VVLIGHEWHGIPDDQLDEARLWPRIGDIEISLES
jgi:hypothetical protein